MLDKTSTSRYGQVMNFSRLLRRKPAARSITLTVENSTPKNMVEHSTGCPCQDDRSAGRFCGICDRIGSHHTDRHDLLHANPWPEQRYIVEFASFQCAGPNCHKVHMDYSVETYAVSVQAAKDKATTRLFARNTHMPTTIPVATDAYLDR